MENETIQLKDESNDRSYFTIIPNYILNHSTAIAQALYLQLKRLAGENGVAYPGSRFLRDKLGVSHNTLKKELNYLLDKGWIKYTGEMVINTDGGAQSVKSYKIVDLWQLNNEYYRGVKIGTPAQRGVKIGTQGVSTRGVKIGTKEEPLKQEPSIKKELISETSFAGKEINDLIDLFKSVNPSYKKFFGNKTQRSAVERLLLAIGREKLEGAIKILERTNQMTFAPVITTPLQLEDKLAQLMSFVLKAKLKKEEKSIAIL
jgi:hypothetical protein